VKLFLLLEYVSFEEGTDGWVVTEERRARLQQQIEEFRSRFSALFMAIRGDEEWYGGCLAARRGFVRINVGGEVEPCPLLLSQP